MNDETTIRAATGPVEVEVSGANKEEAEELFDHAWEQVTEHLQEAMEEMSDMMNGLDVPDHGVEFDDGPMDGFR